MNTLNKVLKLCKMSGCELNEDKDGTFTLYSSSISKNIIVSRSDLNEVLHCLRQYLNNPLKYFAELI